MIPDVCIYHANCADGFTAAWVVQRRFPGIKLVPAVYGDPWPYSPDLNVLIVDFSYPRDELEMMARRAKSIIVLDHHRTAQAELEYFRYDGRLQWGDELRPDTRIAAIFDMQKSGARLAWEYCFPGLPAPALVDYVEDRDLWRWKLPESRAINAAIGAFTQELGQWDLLEKAAEIAASSPAKSLLTFEGKAILLQRRKDIEAIIATTKRLMTIGGSTVPVVNAPFFLASDIGNLLSEGVPFAASYFDNAKGERVFSLRSQTEGADVSEIAKKYGGGGHRNAAGFTMPKGWEGDV